MTRLSLRTFSPIRWLWLMIVAALVLALLLVIVTRATTDAPATTQALSSLVGKPAPDFTLSAEQDGQKLTQHITLAEQHGHPVLLVFLYSLCPHCLNQIETVHALETQAEAPGLRVLYIDSPAESTGIINAYMQRLGVIAPILLDTQATLAASYGVAFYPVTILIAADGLTRQVWVGEVASNRLSAAIAPLLSSQARSPRAT